MGGKKILIHINSLGKGGAERVATVLSGFFVRDGYEVVIVTLWRAKEEYEAAGNVRRINLGDGTGEKAAGRLRQAIGRFTDLRKILRREKPDIVIAFCNKANFRSAYSMLGMRTPLLVSVRNDPAADYAPYKTATKWMERKAAGCVFQTMDAKEFFDLRLQKKSRIIWNPIDEKYLRAAREGDGADWQRIRRESRYIVTVGRISAQKNQMLLLKAFAKIRDRFPETVVRIYGEESENGVRECLCRFIEEQNMSDRVELMGQNSHLERELVDAALFVLPSDYEGMPNALLEAMAMELPVIATDCPCGGAAMLIENGVSGILVRTGDEKELAGAMEKLLSDRELAASMGKNAGKIIDKVSPEKIYEEWKGYVEQLVG